MSTNKRVIDYSLLREMENFRKSIEEFSSKTVLLDESERCEQSNRNKLECIPINKSTANSR